MWRIISYIAHISVLKVSHHKSGFTDLFVIEIFISIKSSWRCPVLALVRYLGVNFIFDPALEMSFFAVSRLWSEQEIMFSSSPKVCSSSLVGLISPALHSNTPCSKSSQNSSPCSKAIFIKCLFLPVALPALLMTFNFLYSESSSLASLHSIVCPGLGSSIVFWMGFCLVGPSLTVWCCSTWSFRVPNFSSTSFSSEIDMFEVSLGLFGEVVGSNYWFTFRGTLIFFWVRH